VEDEKSEGTLFKSCCDSSFHVGGKWLVHVASLFAHMFEHFVLLM